MARSRPAPPPTAPAAGTSSRKRRLLAQSATCTNPIITGTSTSGPITTANAAPLEIPNVPTATAMGDLDAGCAAYPLYLEGLRRYRLPIPGWLRVHGALVPTWRSVSEYRKEARAPGSRRIGAPRPRWWCAGIEATAGTERNRQGPSPGDAAYAFPGYASPACRARAAAGRDGRPPATCRTSDVARR
jgi:hypothetical protein